MITNGDSLEPDARSAIHNLPKGMNKLQTAIAYSQAISLKRIADALTGEGPSILTAPINSYGEGIGDAIQGQMIRGQRGINQYEGR